MCEDTFSVRIRKYKICTKMQEKIAALSDSGHNFSTKLVQLVEKHRILYDNEEDGYTNSQLQDEIWKKIAKELQEDVAAVRIKWKNIRSCYTRYLRQISLPSAAKNTKCYYLARHLQFLLPYCRPRSYSPGGMSFSTVTDQQAFVKKLEAGELDIVEKTEPVSEDENDLLCETLDSENEQIFQNSLDNFTASSSSNKRIEWVTDTSNGVPACSSSKRLKTEEDQDVDPELVFFRSLLPDIRQMNGKQRNLFKISVLNAIDSILYKDS